MNKVWTVLRGTLYEPAHVEALRRQLAKVAPGVELICLTDRRDVAGHIVPLQFTWPGAWAKLELMRQPFDEDMFYLDLDNVAVGNLDDIFSIEGTTVLRDPNAEDDDSISTSVMRITGRDRARIWGLWIKRPDSWMHEYRLHGERKFIESIVGPSAKRWQEELPGQVISFKRDVAAQGLWGPPTGARIVAFHGQPRPWQVKADWIRRAAA